jgi:hypothetical protein
VEDNCPHHLSIPNRQVNGHKIRVDGKRLPHLLVIGLRVLLLAQVQPLVDCNVASMILAAQISQQPAAVTNQFE